VAVSTWVGEVSVGGVLGRLLDEDGGVVVAISPPLLAHGNWLCLTDHRWHGGRGGRVSGNGCEEVLSGVGAAQMVRRLDHGVGV